MMKNTTIIWLQTNCQLIWDLLNNKARSYLPKGISDFLETGDQYAINNGQDILLIVEKYLKILCNKTSTKIVLDTYRRDFSKVKDEKQLRELFSEIAVCATVAKLSTSMELRPKTLNNRRADFQARILDFHLYGEIKRYEDKTTLTGRSIISNDNFKSDGSTTRPRFQDLYSKLEMVYKQLHPSKINFLFVFHPSIGSTENYFKQVLYGENNLWKNDEGLQLESKSLFSKAEWEIVSAVLLCEVGPNNLINFYNVFINPMASIKLPKKLIDKFRNCA